MKSQSPHALRPKFVIVITELYNHQLHHHTMIRQSGIFTNVTDNIDLGINKCSHAWAPHACSHGSIHSHIDKHARWHPLTHKHTHMSIHSYEGPYWSCITASIIIMPCTGYRNNWHNTSWLQLGQKLYKLQCKICMPPIKAYILLQ